MKRIFVILGGLLGLLMLVGTVLFWWLSPPDPEKVLAALKRPSSPVLSPGEALAGFRIADGFRVELVASEPLVVDPVAMDFDDEGRLYVVEMRGFMLDIEGNGEKRPVGRVVVLEDEDGDGQMDSSRTFVDGLVSPRAIAVLPDGVLIGEPPNLIRCRDTMDFCPDSTAGSITQNLLVDYASPMLGRSSIRPPRPSGGNGVSPRTMRDCFTTTTTQDFSTANFFQANTSLGKRGRRRGQVLWGSIFHWETARRSGEFVSLRD
jgi:hypothetical protein